ncbi:unnamed protein product [Mytilus coruscus]|uniref:DDE Tnp4 domain-containing protein n=1 Tax=Mytilus coruscus TaxID=42192 RepID=A0A6J8D832_MYTCO|nr:unnamed protein product [Mytilus coruscus]
MTTPYGTSIPASETVKKLSRARSRTSTTMPIDDDYVHVTDENGGSGGHCDKNDESVKKYTGVPCKSQLIGIFEVLNEAKPKVKYWSGKQSTKDVNNQSCLVCITPSEAFSFISDLWGGNTLVIYITEHSGFLDSIEPGDEIIADRRFTIRDLLTERRAILVIPPFTKKCKCGKGKRLSAANVI